jgi:N-acetylmuramoyl-L-alanine amidase
MPPFRHPAATTFRVRAFKAAFILMAVMCGWAVAQATPTLRPADVGLVGVRFGGDSTDTRVVLDLDAAVTAKFVAEESTGGHLVIALPPLLATGPLQGPGKGLVTGWSIHADASGARLILDTPPGATVVKRFLIPPSDDNARWRYVIDLHDSAGDSANDPVSTLLDRSAPRLAAASPAPTPPIGAFGAYGAAPVPPYGARPAPASAAPAPKLVAERTPSSPAPPTAVSGFGPTVPGTPAPRPALPPRPGVVAVRAAPSRPTPERGLKVIVIDAGHGGHDTGAQSLVRNEKDITLAAALSLRAHLQKMGHYRVVMTRDSDVFIPLEDRVQIARRAGADLFISLHADSAGSDPTPHGASVYTLSDSGETRVNYVLGPREWLSRAGDGRTTPDVRQILLDLTQRSTRNRSSEFAAKLLGHIGDKVDLLPRSHRDANYFVLLAPDVPAVLLEMGFITNPGDEMRLTDPAQRDKLTDAIADAIDDYFYGATRLTAGF